MIESILGDGVARPNSSSAPVRSRDSQPEQRTIASVVDVEPLGGMRMRIFAICFLTVLVDGFDTQAIGFAAKAMSQSLNIPINLFGSVFSAGLFGAMLGAFVLGPLGDRFGRRWILTGCIVVFSACSVFTAWAHGLTDLLAYRFLAGLGLGGAIPNVLALSSEYAPRRMRGLFAGVMYAGFPLGGFVGAIASAQLLPTYGWQPLFYLGGVVPLLLAVLVATVLPESLKFLIRLSNGQAQARSVVERLTGAPVHRDTTLIDEEKVVRGMPIANLFREGRAKPTLLLWLTFLNCFVLLIVLVLWTPALLREAKIGEREAAAIVGLINLGSVFGTALGGKLVDRFGVARVLASLFVAGALSVAALGQSEHSILLLGLCATLSGFFVGAGSSGLLGLAVLAYPTAMRATGVGWAMAMGRFGQVLGPLAVGLLVASAVPVTGIFLWCAVPALLAAALSLLLGRLTSPAR